MSYDILAFGWVEGSGPLSRWILEGFLVTGLVPCVSSDAGRQGMAVLRLELPRTDKTFQEFPFTRTIFLTQPPHPRSPLQNYFCLPILRYTKQLPLYVYLWKGTHACECSWSPEEGIRAPEITGSCLCLELTGSSWFLEEQCALDHQAVFQPLTLFLESLLDLPSSCVISTLSWPIAQSLDLSDPPTLFHPQCCSWLPTECYCFLAAAFTSSLPD